MPHCLQDWGDSTVPAAEAVIAMPQPHDFGFLALSAATPVVAVNSIHISKNSKNFFIVSSFNFNFCISLSEIKQKESRMTD
jgi:hypothetical protein